jgi:hypothetical protein
MPSWYGSANATPVNPVKAIAAAAAAIQRFMS